MKRNERGREKGSSTLIIYTPAPIYKRSFFHWWLKKSHLLKRGFLYPYCFSFTSALQLLPSLILSDSFSALLVLLNLFSPNALVQHIFLLLHSFNSLSTIMYPLCRSIAISAFRAMSRKSTRTLLILIKSTVFSHLPTSLLELRKQTGDVFESHVHHSYSPIYSLFIPFRMSLLSRRKSLYYIYCLLCDSSQFYNNLFAFLHKTCLMNSLLSPVF